MFVSFLDSFILSYRPSLVFIFIFIFISELKFCFSSLNSLLNSLYVLDLISTPYDTSSTNDFSVCALYLAKSSDMPAIEMPSC